MYDTGFDSLQVKEVSQKHSRLALGPTLLTVQWVLGFFPEAQVAVSS